MTPLEWAAIAAAYSLLEYWLGRTDKVKPGSVVEVVLSSVKIIASPFVKKDK